MLNSSQGGDNVICHVNNMILALHLQRKATRARMRGGIMDGSENYFGPDALQRVKQRTEMCLFKAQLVRS